MVLRIVRAGLARGHATAPVAIERHIDLERLAQKGTVPQLIEDVLSFERTIVAPNPRVVAPDDQMRAAEILADQRMDQRLTRSSVTHFDRIASLDGDVGLEIVVDHRLDGARPDLGGNIAGLE